jgi:DNA-binding transcriptional regulator YhcF (GntR family)
MVSIKQVSQRLGVPPHEVRKAYDQLEELGGLHIIAKRFPPGRKRQLPLPLGRETTDKQ